MGMTIMTFIVCNVDNGDIKIKDIKNLRNGYYDKMEEVGINFDYRNINIDKVKNIVAKEVQLVFREDGLVPKKFQSYGIGKEDRVAY